jgi:hypothetical protein
MPSWSILISLKLIAIRVGIHTGLTVVGDIGEGSKHELLALGEVLLEERGDVALAFFLAQRDAVLE